MFVGMLLGLLSMPLLSNKYGNTDTNRNRTTWSRRLDDGDSVAYMFKRFGIALLIGAVAAPLPIVALFVLFLDTPYRLRCWRTARRPSPRTIACNGAGGRVGFEINASRAGPLMRDVRTTELLGLTSSHLGPVSVYQGS